MKIKSILLLIVTFFSIQELNAANCSIIANGNFSNAAIWSCGHQPTKDDNVTINHAVNFNVSFTGGGAVKGAWTIILGASLTSLTSDLSISGTGALTVNGSLQVDNIVFSNGSAILFSSTATVVVNGDFTNNNNSSNVTINTKSFNVSGDLTNGNGGIISSTGKIVVEGTVNNDAGVQIFTCVGVSCGCGDCILAIELIDFRLSNEGNVVKIEWATASEVNNSHFELQRSFDGVNFEVIATILGKGNSTELNKYLYSDNAQGDLIYYRIVDVNFDGVKTDHQILTINLLETKKTNISVIVLSGKISVFGLTSNNNLASVFDLSGRLIISQSIGKDNNSFVLNEINGKSIYVVRITNLENSQNIYSGKIASY